MSAILRFIIMLVGVFWLAIAGAWAMAWWDNRPTHYPQLHLHVWFVAWTWTAPESLRAQRDAAAAQLKTCTANTQTLEAGLATQNAAVQALGVAANSAQAAARSAILRGRASEAMAATRLASLERPIAGDTECARVQAIDKTFMSTLP